jgi:hypothetical protein
MDLSAVRSVGVHASGCNVAGGRCVLGEGAKDALERLEADGVHVDQSCCCRSCEMVGGGGRVTCTRKFDVKTKESGLT